MKKKVKIQKTDIGNCSQPFGNRTNPNPIPPDMFEVTKVYANPTYEKYERLLNSLYASSLHKSEKFK